MKRLNVNCVVTPLFNTKSCIRQAVQSNENDEQLLDMKAGSRKFIDIMQHILHCKMHIIYQQNAQQFGALV